MTDEAYEFMQEALRTRDQLKLIAAGEVQRGKRMSQYEIGPPGMRKMSYKEAKALAQRLADRLNTAINKFAETK